jgi:Fur family zinc uptake transcriptional regulator
MLLQSSGPRRAYQLIADFGEGRTRPKPAIVYRALHFLERMGFIHRIEWLHAYAVCHRPDHSQPAAFLICGCCGGVEEVEPGQSAVQDVARVFGFTINKMVVEAVGVCGKCQS